MAELDKGNARRVKVSVERFGATGAGNVKRLQDIDPPEYRLRVGDYRVRLNWTKKLCVCSACAIGATHIADKEEDRSTRKSIPSLTLRIRQPVSPIVLRPVAPPALLVQSIGSLAQ